MPILFQVAKELSDHYASLKSLPSSFAADHLLPLQPSVSHILSTFFTDHVFFLVPRSDLGALRPRDLPREIFVDEATILPTDLNAPRKKGRPTRRDKAKKATAALDSLDKWLEKMPQIPTAPQSSRTPPRNTLEPYQIKKSLVLDAIYASSDASDKRSSIEQANQFVLDRLKEAEQLVSADVIGAPMKGNLNAGLARAERAVGTFDAYTDGGGILGLLEGAGMTQAPL